MRRLAGWKFREIADQLRECLQAAERRGNSVLTHWEGEATQMRQQSDAVALAGAELSDFRLLREIGRGGMGIVYEAIQTSLHRRVAVKVFPFAGSGESDRLQRFKNESSAAATLQHPNIVPIYAVGCERGLHFYAMHLVEGESLEAVVRRARSTSRHRPSAGTPRATALDDTAERLPAVEAPESVEGGETVHMEIRRVADIGMQVAQALEYAHQRGIVHRDIKPSNLLIDKAGRVWITDFGVARRDTDPGLTATGDIVGTLRYASPEQIQAKRDLLDQRTDVYSLGVTLYELLTLRPAFPFSDQARLMASIVSEPPRHPRQWRREIPADFANIVLKCVEKDSSNRYRTAAELADDLQRFLRGQPVLARRVPWPRRAVAWLRRHPATSWSIVTAVVLLLLGLAASSALLRGAHLRTQDVVAVLQDRTRELDRERDRLRQTMQRERDGIQRKERIVEAANIQRAYDAWRDSDMRNYQRILAQYAAPHRRSLDFAWRLLSAVGTSEHRELAAHESAAYHCVFSDDGTLLATTGQDARVRIYRWPTTELLADFPTGQRETNGLHFLAGNEIIITAGDDGTLRWWNWQTGQPIDVLSAQDGSAFQVVTAAQGELLVSCGADKDIRLWNAAERASRGTLRGHTGNVEAIAVAHDGHHLASASRDGSVRVWDLRTGDTRFTFTGPGPFHAVDFSLDGRLVAAGAQDAWYLFNTADGALVHRQECLDGAQSVAFSTRSVSRLFVGTRDGGIQVWEVNGTSPRRERDWAAHLGRVYALALSPGEDQIVSAGSDGRICISRLTSQAPICQLDLPAAHNRDLALGADGRLLVLTDQQLLECDHKHGEVQRTLVKNDGDYWFMTPIPQAGQLALVARNGNVRIVDMDGRTRAHWSIDRPRRISSITATADGRQLVITDNGADRIAAYDWRTGKLQERWPIEDPFDVVPGSSTRPWLITSGNDLLMWDMASRVMSEQRPTSRLRGHQTSATKLIVHPQLALAATAGNDREIILWDIDQQRLVHRLSGHRHAPVAMAFSPDGQLLASGSSGNELYLWDVRNGQRVLALRNTGPVCDLAFSRCGDVLYALTLPCSVLVLDAGLPLPARSDPPVDDCPDQTTDSLRANAGSTVSSHAGRRRLVTLPHRQTGHPVEGAQVF